MTWPDDFINKIICGDCLEQMKEMDAESVDMCMTSPPYWGLRDYGIEQIFGGNVDCEHEWGNVQTGRVTGGGDRPPQTKWQTGPSPDSQQKRYTCLKCHAWKGQLGLEPTPEMYIEHMTQVFHEVKRVLKKEGTLWLNIGDTYNGSGGDHKDWHNNEAGFQGKLMRGCQTKNVSQLQPKCLCMIPERLAWSLIEDGWILRNKIIWYKPNGMPSSVRDRFSNKWEYLFMFSQQQKYYFDLDAVREPLETREPGVYDPGNKNNIPLTRHFQDKHKWTMSPLGKNPGDVFTIPTQPFPEAHFAVFPEKLCEKPIKAGCPEEVCKKCGKARERIVEKHDTGQTQKMPDYWDADLGSHGTIHRKGRSKGEGGIPIMANKTTGWTSCDCNAGFEGGVVLDPFCGAGTTCYVAKEMGRGYVGIDIKAEYVKLAEKRLAQGVL